MDDIDYSTLPQTVGHTAAGAVRNLLQAVAIAACVDENLARDTLTRPYTGSRSLVLFKTTHSTCYCNPSTGVATLHAVLEYVGDVHSALKFEAASLEMSRATY